MSFARKQPGATSAPSGEDKNIDSSSQIVTEEVRSRVRPELATIWSAPPSRISGYALSKNVLKKGPLNCRSLHGTPGQVGFSLG
jgi:hypothetical protein